MATASAAVHGAMAAAAAKVAADNNGLCVPSSSSGSPKQQQASSAAAASPSSPNEWQDIRDLLGMSSSITGIGSKPSGSSDPGSPCTNVMTTTSASGGVRNKRSSGDRSNSPGGSSRSSSHRLSKLSINTPSGASGGSFKIHSNNNQLQPPPPPGFNVMMNTSPVQIQLHLLAAGNSNNDIHQQPTKSRLRRHSLERLFPFFLFYFYFSFISNQFCCRFNLFYLNKFIYLFIFF